MANLSHYPRGRIVRGFQANGLISAGYCQIVILDPARLRDETEGGT
jgi:hypothetical protein